MDFIFVGLGGFLGSCLRFALTKLAENFPNLFPLGTLFSNIIAGLLIGFIFGIDSLIVSIEPKTKLFITTGFLGGLSTFSTFSLETINMFRDEKYILAFGNIFLNVILSLLGVCIGIFIIKLIMQIKYI